ncbi:MAG TPA: hypothetical protein VFA90_10320 [Terriglobales bacterium]|nr:hypothetical protein [Terriglobales bacterium]
MKSLPTKAAVLVDCVAALSVVLLLRAVLMRTAVHDWWQFAAYLLVASIAARFRVSLPRMTSSMAVNLPFILIAVLELSLVEALTIAAVSTFVQCFWPESKKRNPVQMVFNVSVLVLSAYLTWMVSRLSYHNTALQITASAAMILFANTVPVAAIIAFSEEGSVWSTWKQIFLLTFPYYLVAAGLAALVKLADHTVGWQIPLFVLPATLIMYRSFSAYFRQMVQASSQSPKTMAASA